MAGLAFEDFAEGTDHEVEAAGGHLTLRLETVERLPDSGRPGGSFRLEFRGPADPVLPQAIYPFRGDGESLEIFIVPIGRDEKGTRYEAVFF